ncbi:hypothetical protein ACIBCH_20880 [Amycolatopsis thailandensis]|uniref:hypothetical protein n=1 Tax=Amycolatopsis thailandensis TaxID=589330 RepID=UPI0037878E9F
MLERLMELLMRKEKTAGVREIFAALDEAMPEIEDQRRDYGPEGCAERGVLFGLVVVVAVVFGWKGVRR